MFSNIGISIAEPLPVLAARYKAIAIICTAIRPTTLSATTIGTKRGSPIAR